MEKTYLPVSPRVLAESDKIRVRVMRIDILKGQLCTVDVDSAIHYRPANPHCEL
jgi:hypothetical protein